MALALSVAALAAAPCALASVENATFTASGDLSTSAATIASVTPVDALHSGATINLEHYTGTLYLVGSATGDEENITEQVGTTGNGGYGGRFTLTGASTDSNFTINLSGGTEVSMGRVLAPGANNTTKNIPKIVASNASFYANTGTIASDIEVGTDGLRLNGNSSGSYIYSGTITGSGILAVSVGGNGTSTFTGNVSGFRGTWLNPVSGRKFVFGDGRTGCPGNSVGGTFGRERSKITSLEFNYTGAYSIAGTVYADTLTIANGHATFGGTVDAGSVSIAGTATFSLSESGVYALNGKTVTALTVGGNGTIDLSGTNTFNGTLTAHGSRITIADGAVFGSGELGLLNTLGEGHTSYSDGDNGYASGLSYVLIADSSVQESQTLSYSTTGELEGTTLRLVSGTGLVAETPGDSGAYYINSGKVAYGGDNNAADKSGTSELILANGATVEINKELTVNLTTHGGTIQVNKDDNSAKNGSLAAGQVTATAATTLTGNGNYKVTTNSLGSNIRLATGENGWKGTVTLSNLSANSQDFSGLVNGTYSTLELTGYNGWTDTWNGGSGVNINFKLTDTNNGNTVAWTNGAYTTGDSYLNLDFKGAFSGTGTFKIDFGRTSDAKMNYTFKGDISDWNGHIVKNGVSSSATDLKFQGNATQVKVDINNQGGGTLNVVAGVDGVTFHKDITNATSLQVDNGLIDGVNRGFTATLEGTATVDTLTLKAGATATLSGNGKVALGTTAAPGRLSFEVLQQGTAEAAPAVSTLQEGGAAETPAAATGSLHNGGDAAVSFSGTTAGSAATTYRNLNIKANSTAAFELQGTLDNSAVENNNVGTITVSAPGEGGGIAGLYANKGDIIVTTEQLAEAVSVDVGVLSVTQGTNISVTGADATGVGTIQTGDVRTVPNADAASSTASLTANLVVSAGASLTLPTALDLGGNALTFSGDIRSLNATYSDELKALLFSNASTVTFGMDTYAVADGQITLNGSLVADQENGVLLSGNVLGLDGRILLEAGGTSGVLNVTHSVPEPATATLSLLALAGLCARRRRK